jgi:hypothetical protein
VSHENSPLLPWRRGVGGEEALFSSEIEPDNITRENGLLSLIPSPPQEERETKNGTPNTYLMGRALG